MYGSCMERTGRRNAWKAVVWCTSAPQSLVANIEAVITRMTREQGSKSLGARISLDVHFVQNWRILR